MPPRTPRPTAGVGPCSRRQLSATATPTLPRSSSGGRVGKVCDREGDSFPDGHPEFALWRPGVHKGLKDGKDDPGRISVQPQENISTLDAQFLLLAEGRS